jgi:hypothetical protein
MNENVAQEPAWYIFHPTGFLIVKNPPLYSSNRIVSTDGLEGLTDAFAVGGVIEGLMSEVAFAVAFEAAAEVAFEVAFEVALEVRFEVPFEVIFAMMSEVFCWPRVVLITPVAFV